MRVNTGPKAKPKRPSAEAILSHDQLLAQDVKQDDKRQCRRHNTYTQIVQSVNDTSVVDRINYGPKITNLLAKLRANSTTRASFKAPSGSSSSSV